jgi:ABC-type multidrug transport system fused ATPase/permease subunit
VSSPLDLARTLELVERLQRDLQDARDRAAQYHANFASDEVRVDQRAQRDGRLIQERLTASLAKIQAALEARTQEIQTYHERRRHRILQARQAAQADRLKLIANDEARQVFQVQRELLQVTRDREAGRQQADATLAAMAEALNHERDNLAGLELGARQAWRGYAAFRRLLNTPPAAGVEDPGVDSRQLLQQVQTQLALTQASLAQFRRLLLPQLFSLLNPWLIATVFVGLGATSVPLLRHFGSPTTSWPQAIVSLAVAALCLLALHWLGRHRARPAAQALATNLHAVRARLDAAERAAQLEHQREQQRLQDEADHRTRSLEQHWNRVLEEAEHRRTQLKDQLESKAGRATTHNERQAAHRRERVEREHAVHRAQREREAALESERLQRRVADERSRLEAKRNHELQALATELQETIRQTTGAFSATCAAAERLFPDWQHTSWHQWTPPAQPVTAAPFAHLEVNLQPLWPDARTGLSVVLPDARHFELPLLLRFPQQGSILFETREAGRPEAIRALNNLILRLLVGSPPGRVVFTILDPVGLGQSFAGLMHLTDHEDRLINRRIWTQPDHIEQRLADLNEHIEKVTQLYLRNEYATIAEYNQQAGRIAEAYHFLVIADFPVNFTEVAIRRLLSIADSGPRCGVYTLIQWDRRKQLPLDFAPADLRRGSVNLHAQADRFELAGPPAPGAVLRLDPPPDPAQMTLLLQKVGRSSIDSNRVEMPFAQIAPPPSALWTLDTAAELRVPIGVTGATKLQQLALGKGTRQHVLIAGKTGSGKSTLFHVLITNLALWCRPDQVEFYLVDFKKGVEFKCYATHRLPHARVVAIESDREFGLSVLQRVDEELHRRGDLFRHLGVQDLPGYTRAGGTDPLPRTLLIIDEFQEFFTEDDRVSQSAALLLDRLVRQGRAFGIHVLLGSQTLGGAYTLARTTLGQMVIRIALQCNEADAMLIMDDDNTAPRLLSRPGEAIYNDAAGALEGNSPFQVVWLSEAERETWLAAVQQHAATTALPPAEPVVFEGNAPADIHENAPLRALLREPAPEPARAARIWLGAPNSIKGPTEVVLRRQSGNHLLIMGQNDEAALAMLGIALLSLGAQHPPGAARFMVIDATPPGTPHRAFLERVVDALPHEMTWFDHSNLAQGMALLAAELARRAEPERATTAPPLFLGLHHLERFKALRYEEDFGMTLGDSAAQPDPGRQLNQILCEGAHAGLHVLGVCDSYNNLTRFLSRRAISEFELRVLFQMSASDSASLIDTPRASALGLHRALLHNAQEGTLEVFRPYALPPAAWLEEVRSALRRRGA